MAQRPIIDLHCDLLAYLLAKPSATIDDCQFGASLPFLQAGNVKLQVMAIFTAVETESAQKGLAQAQIFKDLTYQEDTPFYRPDSVSDLSSGSKIGTVAAIESASGLCNETESLESAFRNLDRIISLTGRLFYISLTHHAENRFGGGNYSEAGLKPDGEALLDYINGKEIAIDLSHTSDALAADILDYTYKKGLEVPVLASHSNYRDIWNHPRNLVKEVAQEIIHRGGLIGVNFLRAFTDDDRPEALFEHMKYGLSLQGGEDSICFGADFFHTKSMNAPSRIPFFFPEFENASKYKGVLEELQNDLRNEQLDKLAFGNVERFISNNWT